MSDDAPAAAKAALRERMRERLAAVSREEAARAADAVARALRDCEPFGAARRVALFASSSGEIDTAPARATCERAGRTLLWPRLVGQGLEFAACGFEALRPGRYGVPEPPADLPAVGLGEGDLVLVPGLAFDPEGFRLGRGGGHFDRALAAAPAARTIGVSYAFQRVERVPREAHDRAVEALLDEEGFTWARR